MFSIFSKFVAYITLFKKLPPTKVISKIPILLVTYVHFVNLIFFLCSVEETQFSMKQELKKKMKQETVEISRRESQSGVRDLFHMGNAHSLIVSPSNSRKKCNLH